MTALIVIAVFVIGGIYAYWLDYVNWQKKRTQHGSAKWAGFWAKLSLRRRRGLYLGEF